MDSQSEQTPKPSKEQVLANSPLLRTFLDLPVASGIINSTDTRYKAFRLERVRAYLKIEGQLGEDWTEKTLAPLLLMGFTTGIYNNERLEKNQDNYKDLVVKTTADIFAIGYELGDADTTDAIAPEVVKQLEPDKLGVVDSMRLAYDDLSELSKKLNRAKDVASMTSLINNPLLDSENPVGYRAFLLGFIRGVLGAGASLSKDYHPRPGSIDDQLKKMWGEDQ